MRTVQVGDVPAVYRHRARASTEDGAVGDRQRRAPGHAVRRTGGGDEERPSARHRVEVVGRAADIGEVPAVDPERGAGVAARDVTPAAHVERCSPGDHKHAAVHGRVARRALGDVGPVGRDGV